ncbi:MAG: hypothetical protein ACI8PZ_002123 [Myxococcota bacterium]|jgi:hypothetical protein
MGSGSWRWAGAARSALRSARPAIWGARAGVLFAIVLGCGQADGQSDCTDLGCDQEAPGVSLLVAWDSPENDLADGYWVLTLTVDGVARTCTGTAPYWEDRACDPGVWATGDSYGVETTGLPNSWENLGGPAVDELELDAVPTETEFHLRAEHDGVVVVDDTFEARVTNDFYPNGRECGGGCEGTWRGEAHW